MLEVIYRIYEVVGEEEQNKILESLRQESEYAYIPTDIDRRELLMDCIVCDDREHFKSIIRSSYGDSIKFSRSRRMKSGDLYCIIIGEHCYNTERYFNKVTFKCDHCGGEVTTYFNRPITITDYEIRNYLYGMDEFLSKRFCSQWCKDNFIKMTKHTLAPGDEDHFWVTREGFDKIQDEEVIGYIYKITKKSTNEFYIGQTQYVPVFRWGEHLHTERFPLDRIEDYQFEVLKTVRRGQNILEIEKQYIQSYYKEDPEHSLNIMCTANVI